MTNNAAGKTVLLGVAFAGLGMVATGLALSGDYPPAPQPAPVAVASNSPVPVDPAPVGVLDAQQAPAPEHDDADDVEDGLADRDNGTGGQASSSSR